MRNHPGQVVHRINVEMSDRYPVTFTKWNNGRTHIDATICWSINHRLLGVNNVVQEEVTILYELSVRCETKVVQNS